MRRTQEPFDPFFSRPLTLYIISLLNAKHVQIRDIIPKYLVDKDPPFPGSLHFIGGNVYF